MAKRREDGNRCCFVASLGRKKRVDRPLELCHYPLEVNIFSVESEKTSKEKTHGGK